MVFVRFPQLRQGVNPSLKTAFDPKNLTPSQKMQLTRNRIWGNMIGSNYRTGYKELKKGFPGEARAAYYELAHLEMIYPFIKDWEKINKHKVKYQERKSRIFQRGIKIGNKKGGDSKSGMSMFEMARSKAMRNEQNSEEANFRANVTNKELGIENKTEA